MGDTDSNIKLFNSNSVGNEIYFDKNMKFSGNSLRFNTNLLSTNFGNINFKALANTNAKNELSPQFRFTALSPDLKLGHIGDVKLKGNLENWTTLKLDRDFKKQDITNSARIKLKAQYQKYSAYSAFKFDNSQKKPELKFNGVTLGVQRNFGSKILAYVEAYLPKESFQGTFKNTTYALGMAVKLGK